MSDPLAAAPAAAPTPAPAAAPSPSLARPPVVELRGVTKEFERGGHRTVALQDINFTVEDLPGKGEFIAILGPSGCGKSTILRLIAGLEPHFPPTRGEVLVAGQRVAGPGADRGMVFQDYSSYPNRTVLENVAFGLELRGMPRGERHDIARRWIEKVGLGGHERKYPHELSGGMRQRVAIARTLVVKPRILLMDEPFGALDPEIRYAMQELLIQLWHEVESTVFFITHSISEAAYLGDRVYIMRAGPGRIVEEIKLPRPSEPPLVVESHPGFQEVVAHLKARVHGT